MQFPAHFQQHFHLAAVRAIYFIASIKVHPARLIPAEKQFYSIFPSIILLLVRNEL